MTSSKLQPTLKLLLIVLVATIVLTVTNSNVHSFLSTLGLITIIPIASWHLTRFLRGYILPQKTVDPTNKVVLVTGCDSGFGYLIAQKLHSLGYTVFAGCLFPDSESVAMLKKSTGEKKNKLYVTKLDVTNKSDINSVYKTVFNHCNSNKLSFWGVVNNAGIASYAPAEFGQDTEELDKIFSVNVHGVVRVTKTFLPLIRQSKGRVVNIASMMGRFSFTGLSNYCMSKHAVRSFSDSLRREMYTFGVKVVTIEPMMYSTNIMNINNIMDAIDKIWLKTPASVTSAYGRSFQERFKERAKVSLKTARPQVYEVVNAVTKGIHLADPEVFYRCCGPLERPALWLAQAMPDIIQDVMLTGKTWASMVKFFGNSSAQFVGDSASNKIKLHQEVN